MFLFEVFYFLTRYIMVKGIKVDQDSRCAHWHSALDIVAIKFYCCRDYYACYDCHNALADHEPKVWPKETFRTELAVLCGACKHEMTIQSYLDSANVCPNCNAKFNPKCKNHWALYFDI